MLYVINAKFAKLSLNEALRIFNAKHAKFLSAEFRQDLNIKFAKLSVDKALQNFKALLGFK